MLNDCFSPKPGKFKMFYFRLAQHFQKHVFFEKTGVTLEWSRAMQC
jgi:hypothetical protein